MKVVVLPLLLSSCAFFQGQEKDDGFSYVLAKKDYADHLSMMGTDYINSFNIRFIKLDKKSTRYLEKLYDKIISNESLTLDRNIKPRFYIIDDKRAFFFSLPGGNFFFSRGLFAQYFRNEETFVSAVVYEVIKSNRKIYKTGAVVPTGYLKTEKMLELARIPVKVKAKINEWCYFVMKEINYDPAGILNWIQIQNRNYSDFVLQNGKTQQISEEESLFKQFIVDRGINLGKIDSKNEKSLQSFYHLINYVKERR